jgi:hypothetical protein
MNPDPITDVLEFLLQPAWTTVIFWLLGSCYRGLRLRRHPEPAPRDLYL